MVFKYFRIAREIRKSPDAIQRLLDDEKFDALGFAAAKASLAAFIAAVVGTAGYLLITRQFAELDLMSMGGAIIASVPSGAASDLLMNAILLLNAAALSFAIYHRRSPYSRKDARKAYLMASGARGFSAQTIVVAHYSLLIAIAISDNGRGWLNSIDIEMEPLFWIYIIIVFLAIASLVFETYIAVPLAVSRFLGVRGIRPTAAMLIRHTLAAILIGLLVYAPISLFQVYRLVTGEGL